MKIQHDISPWTVAKATAAAMLTRIAIRLALLGIIGAAAYYLSQHAH